MCSCSSERYKRSRTVEEVKESLAGRPQVVLDVDSHNFTKSKNHHNRGTALGFGCEGGANRRLQAIGAGFGRSFWVGTIEGQCGEGIDSKDWTIHNGSHDPSLPRPWQFQ